MSKVAPMPPEDTPTPDDAVERTQALPETPAESIRRRMDKIRRWIDRNAPEIDQEQRHLDADTPERAYWQYGHYMALRDVLAMLEGRKPN